MSFVISLTAKKLLLDFFIFSSFVNPDKSVLESLFLIGLRVGSLVASESTAFCLDFSKFKESIESISSFKTLELSFLILLTSNKLLLWDFTSSAFIGFDEPIMTTPKKTQPTIYEAAPPPPFFFLIANFNFFSCPFLNIFPPS